MTWQNENLPLSGASANFEGDTDEQYVESLFSKRKAKKELLPPPPRSLPLDAIEEAMLTKPVMAEPGSEEYAWQRVMDVAECPVCFERLTWDRTAVARHITAHPEVQSFEQATQRDRERLESLLAKKQALKEEIRALNAKYLLTVDNLKKFDLSALEDKEKQVERLHELLGAPLY